MGIVGAILTAPLAPARLALWVGGVIQQQVEHEWYDPSVIRRHITEVDEAEADGRIEPREADEIRAELIGRLVRPADMR
ncbi:MAG TPA: gas vesicle protein GvpG [Dactylosporangium sp.]|nr:gas vesicle protein GvpG [Dactylosporangium sp.]